MRLRFFIPLLVFCAAIANSQESAFPLESVAIDGSEIPQAIVLEITGLQLGSPIDKPGIEQACQKLEQSGLFSSISYRYAPGPQKGYAVTLVLADQSPLFDASIDIPGQDEKEVWEWLAARYKRFAHQVPRADSAQKYLAGQIEQHLGSRMRGQHLTVRMEMDMKTGRSMLSLQPEVLPRLQSFSFTGNQAVGSGELSALLQKVAGNVEYTDRKFAAALELNLRPLYEQHGYYRVQLVPGTPQWTGSGVAVNVAITEGAPYRLGKVEIAGENLPADAMLAAARFPTGKLANWKEIQDGIWELEKVVKRTGFMNASASADRSYDDAAHVLSLRVRVNKGPLYRYGEIRFLGMTPEIEAKARQLWRPKTGDAYDYGYWNDFVLAFSRLVDFRSYRKYDAVVRKGAASYVMDVDVVFEPR